MISGCMNTKAASSRSRKQSNPAPVIDDFEDCAVEESKVEQTTLTAFLRSIPHRWQLADRVRFSKEANKRCDALGLAFSTGIDAQLGAVRVYPVKLLRWTYDSIAVECHWPQVVDGVVALEEKHATELRANERAKKHLEQAASDAVQPPEIAAAMGQVLTWLESENKRLREEGSARPPEPPQPLRSI